jgi:RHS repeat-associated protein
MRFLFLFLSLVLQLNVSGYANYIPQENHANKTPTSEITVSDGRSDVLFRFQGQYFDAEINLCYNRFRYYDPDSGNYLSQDPIRLAGGNPTLYAYVHDPNSWVDVFGLDCKATSKARKYEQQIQDMYGGKQAQSQRTFGALLDGKPVNGIADHVNINGKAIEAKYVEDWSKSLRNPNSKIGSKPFAIAEQNKMLTQAQKYSNAFGETIYHTNSPELASHYTKVFQDAGISNVRFEITPFTP